MRPAVTQPSFQNLLVIAAGWLLTRGRHAVTESLVQTRVAGVRSHEIFHRFFSRASWAIDDMGKLVFLAVRAISGGGVRVVVDDTVARKKGQDVYGLGCHLDASRSTRRFKVLCFGHCWVTLAVILSPSFSSRVWALPVLFRLYRNKPTCKKDGVPYKTKNVLAVELVKLLLSWLPSVQRVELLGDSAFTCKTVLKDKAKNLVYVGAVISTARFRKSLPARRRKGPGRPSKYGPAFPKLEELATAKRGWATQSLQLYGETRTVTYKSFVALWPTVCGLQPLRVVLVKCTTGKLTFRAFLSTDIGMTVEQILVAYSHRWAIEVCFRDLKQHLGFADSSARSEKAVLRTAPFIGLVYSCLVLRFARSPDAARAITEVVRPWYPHKKEPSILDLIRHTASELGFKDFRAEAQCARLRRKSARAPLARRSRRPIGRKKRAG